MTAKDFFKYHIMSILPDNSYLKIMYRIQLHKKLNLKNPVTFNEKLQWLKLNDRNPDYTKMVDKYEVKNYIKGIFGEKYLIPTLGIWNSFDEIDFSKLPDQFVLKCTHDSSGIFIVTDKQKMNINLAKSKIQKSLNKKFFYSGREWPYKNVKPRIIAEKYMEDTEVKELRDYKFFCFNGNVRCFKVDFDRFTKHKANYYDRECNLIKFGEIVCPPDFNKNIVLPIEQIQEMIDKAELLSKNIPFVRVDFYCVDKQIYFGELTFYPASGFGEFLYSYQDKEMGDWLRLPVK